MWDELQEMSHDGKKRCPRCKERKLITEFHVHLYKSDGLQHNCKECQNELRRNCKYYTQKDYLGLPNTTKHQYDRLKRTYDATHEQIEMYVYTVACDLCDKDLPPGVSKYKNFDHCHVTGVHRFVLCHHCNNKVLPVLEKITANPILRENLKSKAGYSITIEPREE